VNKSARLAAALIVAALMVPLWAELDGSDGADTRSAFGSYATLPAPPRPALKIGAPARLNSARFLSRWAIIRTAAAARTRPATRAPLITRLAEWTQEGTANAVPVLGSKSDSSGRLWVEVRLPMLPNGRVGWVRRHTLGGYETADTRLVVDREQLRAILYRKGKAVFAAPVGVGTDSWPTPSGEFLIRSELTRYASPFYGPVAFGTTARSAILTDWPGGGFVGIHGTNEPELIPGRISHGCIRMRNSQILRLAALMPVGTPLTIR
jgi:hypothetical protein